MPELITGDATLHPEKKISLILANYANTYLKPRLLVTHPVAPGDEKKFDNHTPFPDRDNIELYNGKPVVVNITLESEPYEIEFYNDKTKAFERAKIEGTKLDITTVLVDVQMNKNIVTTAIDGMNGTVKEYVADGDYKVSLRGALVNPKGTNAPVADFKKLRAICKAPVSVKVTSEFLSLFSIHFLTIEEFSFPQKEGYTNTQLFEINCLSDIAVDIIKINS